MARKLAAVTAADVAGYSRKMEEDEAGTLFALRQLRQEILVPTIAETNGHIIKSMGDGWLIEHASALDALSCATAIQRALENSSPLAVRIGVHVGDIVSENEDIFGDGVNVAARLQETAQPGGIVASEFAIRSAKGPLVDEFRDGGTRKLKNISANVRVFAWGAGRSRTGQRRGPGTLDKVTRCRRFAEIGLKEPNEDCKGQLSAMLPIGQQGHRIVANS